MKKLTISLGAIAATVMSLGLVSAAQAELRVGPNYKLDSDSSPFRGRDQVALAVNPANAQHVVAVNANYLDSTCETSRSLDGGLTWDTASPLSPPAPTAGQEPFLPSCSSSVGTSQYAEFGTGDNVYTVATATRRNSSFTSVLVYKSTNGGQTWQGVVAIEGDPQSWYRPSLSVHRGGGTAGADRIHIVARVLSGGSGFRSIVSNDGGQSFSAPVSVTLATTTIQDFPSKPVVDFRDGSVTVVWRTAGVEGLLQASRSTDGGKTWGAPVDIARVKNTGNNGTTHLPIPPGTTAGASTSASYPRLAGDPRNGNLYLVYSQGSEGPNPPAGGFRGADHFISYDSQVYFQRSLDGGATWSTPKMISDGTAFPGSTTHQTRHPSVSVSADGRINIVWHDRRHWYQGPGERNCTHSHIFCEDVRLGDTYYSYSTDGGATFSPDIRVNDRSHNNEVGYDTRPSGYWWFGPQSVTVGGGQELIGWMDSREGNWDTDTEDIYLAKVDFDATGEAPQTVIDEPDAINRAVALSQLGYRGGNEGALVGYTRDPANAGLPACPSTNPPTIDGCAVFGPASRNASTVVIVNKDDVAGAMAATVLARAFPGPVLLSPSSGLPVSVKDEIARMRPANAFVVGDSTSLSEQVVTDVNAAAGFLSPTQIVRLSGGGDAGTAALVAAQFDHRTGGEKASDMPAFDAAVIANPASPDAAAAVALAAARRLPVLYVNADSIPSETTAALDSLDIKKALVIGGPAVVGPSVVTQLGSQPKLTDGVTRLGVDGGNQYATSSKVVAESKERGMPSNVVYVADGSRPMDATLLSGVVARATGMLVLAPAPLQTNATAQASSFGLTGISRFFLLLPPPPADGGTPPVGGGTPPAGGAAPPAGTPPAPTPGSAVDKTAPTATISFRKRQKLGSRINVRIRCRSEACSAIARATIRLPKFGRVKGTTLKLKRVTARLSKGASRNLSFKLSKAHRKAIGRALRARKPVSAKLVVSVRDAAGNTRVLRGTVRFTR